VFPRSVGLATRYAILRYLGYLPLGVLVGLGLTVPDRLIQPDVLAVFYRIFLGFDLVAVVILVVCVAFSRFRSSSPIVQEQSRLILLGAAIAFGPMLVWAILQAARQSLAFSAYLLVPWLFSQFSWGTQFYALGC